MSDKLYSLSLLLLLLTLKRQTLKFVGHKCRQCRRTPKSSRVLSISFFFLPKRARLNRLGILPKTTPRLARFLFRGCVQLAVFWRLLPLIFFVMPGHAGLDLFQVDIFSFQKNLSYQSSVLIGLFINDGYILTKNHLRKILL
jgi:hypothetical protein